MPSHRLLLLCSLFAAGAVLSWAQERPALTGYVTRAASNSDFDVNGMRVLCSAQTLSQLDTVGDIKKWVRGCPREAIYVGEALVLTGHLNAKADTYDAIRIDRPEPAPSAEVSGSALIEVPPVKVQGASAQVPDLILRADGYRIYISAKTKIEWNPPLHSPTDVKAGDWIKYRGDQNAAGVVMAYSARIGPLVIPNAEASLRKQVDYDPSAVPPDAKQDRVKSIFVGYDPEKFPPSSDAAMQTRVEKIGNSLIPPYQHQLLGSDPARIDFRFQVIDTQAFLGAVSLPSGVILIPHQVVERMQSDSQVAAILAGAVACILERQAYRDLPPSRALAASEVGAAVLGAFVPGALLVESMVAGTRSQAQASVEEQNARVSLDLLRDAGYDIDQAPVAWWLLGSNKPKPITKIDMPDRAIYLYRVLGEDWNNPAASITQAR